MTQTVIGSQLRLCVGPSCITTTAQAMPGGSGVGLGRLVFSSLLDGGHRLLIDDVTVAPALEPPVSARTVRTLAGVGQPCVLDAECTTGRCGSSGCTGEPSSVDAGDGPRRRLAVGCSCSPSFFAVLALATFRRARSRHSALVGRRVTPG